MTTRREVLGGLAAVTLASSALGVPLGMGVAPRQRWPDRFVWGVATAARQIEGNNIGSDYSFKVRDFSLVAHRRGGGVQGRCASLPKSAIDKAKTWSKCINARFTPRTKV